jgi:hypothetical protein
VQEDQADSSGEHKGHEGICQRRCSLSTGTAKRGRAAGRPVRGTSSRERSADIRAWAKGQGIKVNERGRIPASVVEQYEAAH